MANKVMVGFKRPVLVRTKHNLFGATIAGEWYERNTGLSGPVVRTPDGILFNVDWKRIVRFTDTDEIPWREIGYEV